LRSSCWCRPEPGGGRPRPDGAACSVSGGSAAYPGRTGIVGGGCRRLPPIPMPVPLDGGASPSNGVVPSVTSASGLSPTPRPTTAPPEPSPTDAEAATADGSAVPCGLGGASRPSVLPPDPAAVPSEPPAVAGRSEADGEAGDPATAGFPLVAPGVERPARIRAAPEAGTGGGTGADADRSPLVPAGAGPDPMPPDGGTGPSRAGLARSDGPRPDRSEPRRFTAAPLAMSTMRAAAIASPTNAPRRGCSAKKVLPQTPQTDRTERR